MNINYLEIFDETVKKLREEGYIVDVASHIDQVFETWCHAIACAYTRKYYKEEINDEIDSNYVGRDDEYSEDFFNSEGCFGIFDSDNEDDCEICTGVELLPTDADTVDKLVKEIKDNVGPIEESFKSNKKMTKKLCEDVETVYKVTSVIFPDVEETEEFDSEEDAMHYAQEQLSSGNYDEVIVSKVTIDEDGYEDEAILLDEQGQPDGEEYEPQLTTDRMNAGQWYESLDKEKDKYSVLREALDRLDREDDKAREVKTEARVKGLR